MKQYNWKKLIWTFCHKQQLHIDFPINIFYSEATATKNTRQAMQRVENVVRADAGLCIIGF